MRAILSSLIPYRWITARFGEDAAGNFWYGVCPGCPKCLEIDAFIADAEGDIQAAIEDGCWSIGE